MRKRPPLRTVVLTALRFRCPRCRDGRMFRGWPNRVWRHCPACGLPFIRESGYYIGGMILNYIFTALTLLAAFFGSLLLPFRSGISDNYLLWTGFAIVLALLFVRPAYSLWLAFDYWVAPWEPGEDSASNASTADAARPNRRR
jgi:uncharacterized protein (DUF983 family)